MKSLVFSFGVFLSALFIGISFSVIAQSPSTPPAANALATNTATTQSPDTAMQTKPGARITAYTLPPDIYRKAHNRGRLNFVTHIVSFFYALLVLWFVLRKLSAKFRDWTEKVSRFRFVQAIVFTLLLVLSISILQLPLDIF